MLRMCSPRRLCWLVWACLLPWRSDALGPHEVAVLVNDASPRSLEVANHFIHLRRIPPENVIHMRLPEQAMSSDPTLTREDFASLIWEPATRALRERGLDDHILAWAYSADFPVRIVGDPEVSLHGLTFVRNQLPPAEDIRKGRWASPLFAGPGENSPRKGPTRSLEQYASYLQTNMPLPNMMIAHTGARGQTVAGAIEAMRVVQRAEGGQPAAEVAFLLSDDVRSKARAWQYADTAAELLSLGLKATVTSNAPDPSRRLMGLMMGAARPDPAASGHLMPGSLADHLTSYAAAFVRSDQGMLTAWLRAGAAASAGTVTEPYAIWSKFPHARLFAHYASGCSILESYAQALASPLQIQLVGDPLASPWAKPPGVTLVNLGEENTPVAGAAQFLASTWASPFEAAPMTLFLLDGRSLNLSSTQSQISIDTSRVPDGYHSLRVIAYTHGLVRHQGFDERPLLVRNAGRAVRLTGLAAGGRVDLDHVRRVGVEADGEPTAVSLWSQSRAIASAPWGADVSLEMDPRLLGAGPQTLQAVAVYEDGQRVASPPVRFTIERLNQPPVLASLQCASPLPGVTRLTARVQDPEGDPVTVLWSEDLFASDAAWTTSDGPWPASGEERTLQATGALTVAVADATRRQALVDVAVEMAIPQADAARVTQTGGLVFDYRDAANFSFFGWCGGESGWVLGAYEGGNLRREGSRGAFLEPDHWYRLAVRKVAGDTVEALVDDEVVLRRPRAAPMGTAGLLAGMDPVRYRAAVVAPPCRPDDIIRRVAGADVEFTGTRPPELVLRLRDPTSERLAALPAAADAVQ